MFLKALPKFFFYHHFFMSVCTVMLCMQTFWLLEETSVDSTLLLFLFAATLFSYNFHFFLAVKKDTGSEQLQWFKHYNHFTVALLLLSVTTSVWLFFRLGNIKLYILIAAVLNGAYTAPLLFKSAIQLPLPFTYVKSYFIGFTWAVATVILPIVYLHKEAGLPELCIFIHRFLLVSLATLIFDYRDRVRDRQMGIQTPANTMSTQQYHLFFLINIAVFSASTIALILLRPLPFQWLQILPCFYLWWLYLQSRKQKNDLFFLSYVDGALFLSALLSIFLLI